MRLKPLVFIFFLLLFSSIVIAAPPVTTVQTGSYGCDIAYSKIEALKIGADYISNIHVFNATSGYPLQSGILCTLDYYNSTGSEILERYYSYGGGLDYNLTIPGSLNVNPAVRSMVIFCNSSTMGCFASMETDVTLNGRAVSTDGVLITVFFLVFIAFIGLALYSFFGITLLKMTTLDMGLMDGVINLTIFLSAYTLNYFNIRYLGNILIDSVGELFVTVGALTHVLIPIVVIILSATIGELKRNRKANDN